MYFVFHEFFEIKMRQPFLCLHVSCIFLKSKTSSFSGTLRRSNTLSFAHRHDLVDPFVQFPDADLALFSLSIIAKIRFAAETQNFRTPKFFFRMT